jgi:hypothetical protein
LILDYRESECFLGGAETLVEIKLNKEHELNSFLEKPGTTKDE